MGKRRQHSGEFKARVVVAALKGQKTVNELASKYGIHPVQVSQWKKEALEELPSIFGQGRMRAAKDAEEEESKLYEQIGRLKMELEWLKKKASLSD